MGSVPLDFSRLVMIGCVGSDSDIHDVRDNGYVDADAGSYPTTGRNPDSEPAQDKTTAPRRGRGDEDWAEEVR